MRDVKLLKQRGRSAPLSGRQTTLPAGQWIMAIGIFGLGFVLGATTSNNTDAAPPTMSLEELAHQTKALDTLSQVASDDPRVAALSEASADRSDEAIVEPTEKNPMQGAALALPVVAPEPARSSEVRVEETVEKKVPSLKEALAGLQEELTPDAEIFTVQVSSFPTTEEATAFARRLERKGFEPYITAAEIPGRGTWHRVRVGNYPNKDGAEVLRDRLAAVDVAGLVLKAKGQ